MALADARIYEAEKAATSPTTYLQLRTLEAETQRWKTWDGKFPSHWATYFTVLDADEAARTDGSRD